MTSATSGGSGTSTYDEENRLTQIVQKSGSGVNERKSEFVYDGLSRKVTSREYSWDTAANAGAGAWVQAEEVRR